MAKFTAGCPICGYTAKDDASQTEQRDTKKYEATSHLPLWIWIAAISALIASLAALISVLI